jgi:exosortase
MLVVGAGVHFGARDQAGNLFSLIDSAGAAVGILGGLVLLLDWSIGTTLFGLGVFFYGIWPGQNDYLKDMGMIATLFGIVLLTGGRQIMRIAWFPIVFLVCAIPWPGLVYSWVSTPLSQLAAWVAVQLMQITGINCGLVGTKIVIDNIGRQQRVLNVEEACAGLRSLMTYVSMAGAIAFLSSRALWQKLVIVASAIPIAISCNMLRITVVGELDRYASTNWTDGFAHQFVGLMMLIPAFLMLLTLLWVLDRVVIEEADETAPAEAVTAGIVTRKAPAILKKPTSAGGTPDAVSPAVDAPVAAAPAPVVGPVNTVTKIVEPQVPAEAVKPIAAAPVAKPVAPTVVTKVQPALAAPTAPAPIARAVAVAPAAPVASKPAVAAVPAAVKPAGSTGVVPPRPAGAAAPGPGGAAATRPAATPGVVRPAAAPAVRPPDTGRIVPPRPAGSAPPRPVTAANPAVAKPAAANPPAGQPAAARPGVPRPVAPGRPPQQVVPPKPTKETP